MSSLRVLVGCKRVIDYAVKVLTLSCPGICLPERFLVHKNYYYGFGDREGGSGITV